MKPVDAEEILVSSRCFRQRVNLPATQVAGLAEAELAAALCFEIEPFSGIPRADGRLAWRRVDASDATRAVFDVVQMRASDLAAEGAAARKAKRRVRGVTAEPDAAVGETVDDLPFIPLKQSGGSGRRLWIPWAICGLLVALALAWDFARLRAEASSRGREVAVQRTLQSEKSGLEGQIAAAQREAQALRETRAAAAQAQQNADVLRAAWRTLLAALPRACADEGIVRSVKATGPFAAEVSGVALSADAAARVAARLTEELKPPASAWMVSPGALGASADGGTVVFACMVEFDPQEQFK